MLIRRLLPDEGLSTETNYAVYEDYGEDQEPWYIAEFTTGLDIDEDAPSGGEILKARSHRNRAPSSACGGGVQLDIEIEPAEKGAIYEIEVTRASGDVEMFTFLNDDWLSLGHGGCTTNMPDLKASEDVELRIRALDVSGNVGTWSNPIGNTHGALGCSSVGNAGLASGWMALLALAGMRRRR